MSLRARNSWSELDWIEALSLLAFGTLSLWVIALDLWQVVAHHWSWTGTGGVFLVDQMQYLAWIREASHHVLISNLFAIGRSPADLFQPLILVSGVLTALGLPVWLALLVWQPVAVLGLFWAVRAYVTRALDPSGGRRTALVLALFFVGSGAVVADQLVSTGIVARLQLSAITSDLWLGFWSWGYSFGLIGLAAATGALLIYDRGREAGDPGLAAPALGALASLIHPWQGAILIMVVVGAEALCFRRGERSHLGPLAAIVVASGLPLLYFAVLSRTDAAWRLAQAAAGGSFPLWMILVSVAPLALPALLGYLGPAPSFLALVTRLWPVAAVILFLVSETGLSSVPTHALLGISLPLAVLAVHGVRRSRLRPRSVTHRVIVALLAGIAFLPGTVHELSTARSLLSPGPVHGQSSGPGDANFVSAGERHALDYLDASTRPGAVLTRFYLGTVVPGLTGRETYVGSPYYSPDYLTRSASMDALFLGQMDARAAQNLARASGARFLLADCRSPARLAAELAPISASVHHFGCATVFAIR